MKNLREALQRFKPVAPFNSLKVICGSREECLNDPDWVEYERYDDRIPPETVTQIMNGELDDDINLDLGDFSFTSEITQWELTGHIAHISGLQSYMFSQQNESAVVAVCLENSTMPYLIKYKIPPEDIIKAIKLAQAKRMLSAWAKCERWVEHAFVRVNERWQEKGSAREFIAKEQEEKALKIFKDEMLQTNDMHPRDVWMIAAGKALGKLGRKKQ